MLKKTRILFLGLVVCAGSACVTPTHASSASPVIITYIQAAGPGGAKDELIVIYNQGETPVDVTGWCLTNKVPVAFACLSPRAGEDPARYTLPPYGYGTIVSESYGSTPPYTIGMYSFAYEVTNQSSGSIVASSDTISLLDTDGETVDSRSWSTAIPSGKAWQRLLFFGNPDIYSNDDAPTAWQAISWIPAPESALQTEFLDPAPEEEQAEPETNPTPTPQPPVLPSLVLTEIFANPSGSDVDKEYIEIYNPTDKPQSLNNIQLRIGLESPKWYAVPDSVIVQPYSYHVFFNGEVGFTLVNTNGGVQLFYDDIEISSRVDYVAPKDNQVWALIEGEWMYTSVATPGAVNQRAAMTDASKASAAASTTKPCASNQYRNPETGRCKLVASTSTTLTPCKPGQERSAETNRCRNLTKAPELAACKEGQERNTETNRCRNIVKMSRAEHGIQGVQEKAGAQLSWYYWLAIIAIVALIVGYAIWEWRQELSKLWRKVRLKLFAKKRN